MKTITRRQWLFNCGVAGAGLLMGMLSTSEAQTPEQQVVKVTARRFNYTPDRIVLKKGRAILEFTSIDFVHGFSIPDLKVRADLVPGKITRVELNFEKEGKYDFLCDNFCGSGHEEMNGYIIVT